MKKSLLGMGAAAMDTLITCPALPKSDSFQIVTSERLIPGGSCANMLVAFAALGGTATLIAKIGDDDFGRQFRRTLAEDGVSDRLLITRAGGTTLHTYVWAADSGDHCIFINFGDSLMNLQPQELDASMLTGVDLFYTDLFPGAPAVDMAKRCREQGIPVIICLECPPSFMEAAGVAHEDITTALSLADLIISGREGFAELTENADYTQALASVYRQYHPRYGAICTAGDQGAVWVDDQDTVRVSAYRIDPIDSTGAGDSFLGALLYSYFVREQGRRDAMAFAAAVGAMKCLKTGPRIKPTPAEVSRFMTDHRQ